VIFREALFAHPIIADELRQCAMVYWKLLSLTLEVNTKCQQSGPKRLRRQADQQKRRPYYGRELYDSHAEKLHMSGRARVGFHERFASHDQSSRSGALRILHLFAEKRVQGLGAAEHS